MTYKHITLAAFIALPFFGTAQTYAERFSQINGQDTAAQRQFLEAWERAQPNAPDLYTKQFVYYADKFLDEQNPVDRLNLLMAAATAIDKGMTQYPDRLDMIILKQQLNLNLNRFDLSAAELVKANEYGHKMNHKWKEQDGKPIPDGEKYFLMAVEDFINDLLKKQDDELVPHLKPVSVAVLQYYPNHARSLYARGLAHEYDGENDKAKVCYEKMLQYGTENEKKVARGRIALLK